MLEIIPASDFTTIPWKNGLGKTVEMAINEGGSVDKFDWRISQATVANDGEFSDFSGLERNLVLIKGNGLSLLHTKSDTSAPTPEGEFYCQEDHLTELLDYANFDGGFRTLGKLHDGEIIDLNIMTAANKFDTQIITAKSADQLSLPHAGLLFVYSLSGEFVVVDKSAQYAVPNGGLAKISKETNQNFKVTGEQLIIAAITAKQC